MYFSLYGFSEFQPLLAQTAPTVTDTFYTQSNSGATSSDRDSLPIGSLLKPGDALRISVFPDTQSFLNGIYELRPDGAIELPVVGLQQVESLSVKALEKRLSGIFLRYLRYPFVQVTPLIRIGFVGGFQKPGYYFVNHNATLWDALRLAGGPVREDGLRLMRWERGPGVFSVNLEGAVKNGGTLKAMGVKSGDWFTVTTRPKKTGWETFSQDVVPVLQLFLVGLTTTATLYLIHKNTGGL